MKSLTKKVGILATVLAIALLTVCSSLIFSSHVYADTDTDYSYKYYYEQISIDPMAEKFYKAFETLANNGEFKKGTIQYDLIDNNVVSEDAVKAYVNGNDGNKLVKAFGMGRDGFYLDHPDLFYVDLFATSISAGMKGDKYTAYLDSSRVLTMYRGDSVNSESAVNNAITEYNNAIAQVVNEAKILGSAKAKIEYVNEYISSHNTYGYGTKVENGRNVDTPKADFIYTSYGALVNNESVCEGYAKSFKAIMDRLEIPCVCVQGYADGSGKGNYEPHMWNYVQVDGMWYAVDVTYNATSGQVKWMLKGGQSLMDTHIEDGVVSSSGYELRYPAIKPYDYGIDADDNGMEINGEYEDTDTQGKLLTLTISYDGKGAKVLEGEGKYMVYRYNLLTDGTLAWTNWTGIVAMNEASLEIFDAELYPTTNIDTKITIGTTVESIQFAIVNRAPDMIGDMYTGENLVSYSNLSNDEFIVKATQPYRNNGYGSYTPAPGAAGVYPSNAGDLPVDKTYDIKITYNTQLELTEGMTADTIAMDFYSSRANDSVKQYAVIENVKWDGDRTITFTFTPSKMYIHNLATYYFTPVGLVGANSKKVPDYVAYTFKGKSVVCSKVFNDGRLYMSVYGEPTLIDNTDLSVTDFKDENGNYFAESQRSQLILVANKTSAERTEELDGVLKENTAIKDDEVVSSATYEIDLQICGMVRTVPNGSYMQVAFGFPEGYSPDDEGTTFQIYHYKHDDKGNIIGVEEIPVIVTQYGLIAKVTSFSPFTIVQLKNTSEAVQESDVANIYAYVNGGVGGSITSGGKSGISQVSDKIVYDITPNEGYTVSYVRLNGKVVDSSKYANGKLTLAKSNIESSNTLEVAFMAKTFADTYASQGLTLAYGEKSNVEIAVTDIGGKSNLPGIIIGCVVAVVVVAAIVLAVFFVLKKKKAQPVATTAGAKSTSKAKATKQAEPKKTTKTVVMTSAPKAKQTPTKDASANTTKTASAKSSTTATKATGAKSATTSTAKSTSAKSIESTPKTTATKSNSTAKPTNAKTTVASKTSTASKSATKTSSTANKSTSAKSTSTKASTTSKSTTAKKK